MKKLLTITLVFVFTLALALAIGCAQKEEPAMETGGEMMEEAAPSTGDAMTDTTGGAMMADTMATGSE